MSIQVKNFTFKSSINMDTIFVETYADGKLIKTEKYSAVTYTPTTAEARSKSTAEGPFGVAGSDGEIYEKAPTTNPNKYEYEIKKFGPQSYLIAYEMGSAGETKIYESSKLIGASESTFVQTAILGLQDSYPGIENMTRRPSPTPPPTAPEVAKPTPPVVEPAPAVNENNKPFFPKFSYKKPKTTKGDEFIEIQTQNYYTGSYVETSTKQYFAGKTPEETGIELKKIKKNKTASRLTPAGLMVGANVLFTVLQAFFVKRPSASDLAKGKTKRYFVQDKKTDKIVETDEQTYNQVKLEMTNQRVAETDWILKGPAKDQVINGYPFKGAESKNQEAIQALEAQMPGISKYVTDYSFLVTEPVSPTARQLTTQTIVEKDAQVQLDNDRKANFDLKK